MTPSANSKPPAEGDPETSDDDINVVFEDSVDRSTQVPWADGALADATARA